MGTTDRKQRELQQRDSKILEVARGMLYQSGYNGLNMDRIAQQLEYAKGTIYNRFRNKEEIIIALAIQTMEKRTQMFERAAAFPGRTRERLTAVGLAAELFIQRHPDHFKVEQIIRNDSIWDKTSEARRNLMRSCEMRCIGIVGGIVRDAIAQQDLQLPDHVTPEDLVFGLWALNFGAFTIISTSEPLAALGIGEPVGVIRHCFAMQMDGFGWRPLSSEHDYAPVYQRVAKEVFGGET